MRGAATGGVGTTGARDYALKGSIAMRPVIDILFCFVARQSIGLMDVARENFSITVDLVDLIVGQSSPLRLYFAFELTPIALKGVTVHGSIPRSKNH